MFNRAMRTLFGAAFVAALAVPAVAADFYEPPIVEAPPPVYKELSGEWYIRGHIGMSNQQLGSLYNVLFDTAPDLVVRDKNFESGGLFGIGVGYKLNRWLRGDLTAEYRGETGFHGMDTFTDGNGDPRFNNYTAKKSEWLFLANAYADLGEWHGISPYVGAGIGASRNTIHSFRDAGIGYGTPGDPSTGFPTMAFADNASKWNLAWAVHAGLGFQATDNLTVDLGYSFVHLGDARTGDIVAFDGTNAIDNPMHFRDITSHDFKLGVRYAFGGPVKQASYAPEPAYEPEPLVYK